MPRTVPPGPFPYLCAHMAYLPRSVPAFDHDIQHDFRDFQLDRRLETLSGWVSTATGRYLRAARITGVRYTDPLAVGIDTDTRFDARTLSVAHDHLAAWWRANQLHPTLNGREQLVGPGERSSIYVRSPAGLLFCFRRWLDQQIGHWEDHTPITLRLMLRVMAGEHTATGQRLEAEFYFTLADIYPLPGPPALPKPLLDPFSNEDA